MWDRKHDTTYVAQFSVLIARVILHIWHKAPAQPPMVEMLSGEEASIQAQQQLYLQARLELFARTILKKSRAPQTLIVLALLYVRRVASKLPPSFTPEKGSELGIFAVCLTLADIYQNDVRLSMKAWTHYTGIPSPTLLRMRGEVLRGLDYELYTSVEEYQGWMKWLKDFVSQQQSYAQQIMQARRACGGDGLLPRKRSTECEDVKSGMMKRPRLYLDRRAPSVDSLYAGPPLATGASHMPTPFLSPVSNAEAPLGIRS